MDRHAPGYMDGSAIKAINSEVSGKTAEQNPAALRFFPGSDAKHVSGSFSQQPDHEEGSFLLPSARLCICHIHLRRIAVGGPVDRAMKRKNAKGMARFFQPFGNQSMAAIFIQRIRTWPGLTKAQIQVVSDDQGCPA